MPVPMPPVLEIFSISSRVDASSVSIWTKSSLVRRSVTS
jgi:hypothetical protein